MVTGNERDVRGSIAGRAGLFIGFEVLTAVVMKGCVIWAITAYSPYKVK
jgi:hypothetical protein